MINFAIKKSVILIQSKKGCLNDFGFLYFAIQKHLWTWFHINLARFAPYAPLPIRAISVSRTSSWLASWSLTEFFQSCFIISKSPTYRIRQAHQRNSKDPLYRIIAMQIIMIWNALFPILIFLGLYVISLLLYYLVSSRSPT